MKFIFALLAFLVLAVQCEFHDEVHEIEQHNFVAAIKYTKKAATGIFEFIADWWSSYNQPHTCTATIVSNDRIVTAGRCVFDTETVTLIVGSSNTEEPYDQIEISEDEIHVHPDFSMLPPYLNDVAVIQLEKPLHFNLKVGKVSWAEENYREKDDDRMTAFGYRESMGRHRTHADTNLYKIATRVWIFEQCQHLYSEHTFGMKHYHVLDHKFQFCFRLLDGEYSTEGKYIGGPVLTEDNKFIGIVSHYIDGLPQVCTLVSAYRDFINNPKSHPKVEFQKLKTLPSKNLSMFKRLLRGFKKEKIVQNGAKNKKVDSASAELASPAALSFQDQIQWAGMYDHSKSEESRLHAELDALQGKYNILLREHQKLLGFVNLPNVPAHKIENVVSAAKRTPSKTPKTGHDKLFKSQSVRK